MMLLKSPSADEMLCISHRQMVVMNQLYRKANLRFNVRLPHCHHVCAGYLQLRDTCSHSSCQDDLVLRACCSCNVLHLACGLDADSASHEILTRQRGLRCIQSHATDA